MKPEMFSIGNFSVTWYSFLIMIGVVIATIAVIQEGKKFNIEKNFLINLIFWTILFGIIGARLYYVAFNWSYYSEYLSEIPKIWHGGLAIHGGLIVGFFTILIYCKKYKVSTARVLDMSVPFVILAQAIGRWGNFFNQEAYGAATSISALQKLGIPNIIIQGMEINGIYYTPTFLYESLWCIIGFILLLIIRKLKYIKVGQTTGVYLMWYSVGRFIIEGLRMDSLMLGYFRVAQIVSVLLFMIGLVTVISQGRKDKLTSLYNTKEQIKPINF